MVKEFKPNLIKILICNILIILKIFLIVVILINYKLISNFIIVYGVNIYPFLKDNEIYVNYTILAIFIYYFISLILDFIVLIGNTINTRYLISKNYISQETNFFTKIKLDIPIKNITNIDYSISWLCDKIFRTGSIVIFTSGSGTSDLDLIAVNDIKDKYNYLFKKVNPTLNNLNINPTQNLIEKIKPNVKVAVFISLFYSIFLILILFFQLFGFKNLFENFFGLEIFVGFLIISFFVVISFISYKKKEYNFYDSYLEYYDGFFNFNKVNIPYSRITNLTLNNNLIDRIFNVSRISIDTAGSEFSELKILYVNNGEDIVNKLKEVIKENGRN